MGGGPALHGGTVAVFNRGQIKETAMAFGTNIRTFWEGRWHDADLAVMRAADHGMCRR